MPFGQREAGQPGRSFTLAQPVRLVGRCGIGRVIGRRRGADGWLYRIALSDGRVCLARPAALRPARVED